MDPNQNIAVNESNTRRRRRLKSTTDLRGIDEYELDMMKLTAHNCRQINAKNQENLDPKKLKLREKRVANSNNGFFVKSGDSKASGLSGNKHLPDVYPSNMCPNVTKHLHYLFVMKLELPLACPTCWSLQRNAD
jgi:hypothetical protein